MQWGERIGRRLKLRDLHILLAVAKSGTHGQSRCRPRDVPTGGFEGDRRS
jgi:hypothetical protein